MTPTLSFFWDFGEADPFIQASPLTLRASKMENSWELHMPGYNYMGPGTHVVSRILSSVHPTSRLDRLSLVHDIRQLTDVSSTSLVNDMNMKIRSGNPLVWLALSIPRQLTPLGTLSQEQTRAVGFELAYLAGKKYSISAEEIFPDLTPFGDPETYSFSY